VWALQLLDSAGQESPMARAEHMERACATLSSVGRSVAQAVARGTREGGGDAGLSKRRDADERREGACMCGLGRRAHGWSVGRYWRSRASRKSRWRKPRGSERESRRSIYTMGGGEQGEDEWSDGDEGECGGE